MTLPALTAQQALSRIDALPISEKWKADFRAIAEGEPFVKGMPHNYAQLRIRKFRFLPFLFSAFYYFAKGMVSKGFMLLAFGVLYATLLTLAEIRFNLTLPNAVYYAPLSAYCTIMAPIDYYRQMIHEEKIWPAFSWARHPLTAGLVFVFTLLIGVIIIDTFQV